MEQPQTAQETLEKDPLDLDLWWGLSFVGMAIAGLGGFVLYETFQIFAAGLSDWFDCVGQQGALFGNCGEDLSQVYVYRFGVSAALALGLSLVALFFGPIPLIITLNRFRNHIVSGILFFTVMIPYSLIAFLTLILGIMVASFYLMSLVT